MSILFNLFSVKDKRQITNLTNSFIIKYDIHGCRGSKNNKVNELENDLENINDTDMMSIADLKGRLE